MYRSGSEGRQVIRKFLRTTIGMVLLAAAGLAIAQSCTKTGSQCVQGAETRVINGVTITRDCWQYQDTYECYDANAVDTCAPLRSIQGCFELTSTCSEQNFSGQCIRFATTMRCDHREPTPPGATAVAPVYNVTQDQLIASSICGQLAADANCTKTGRTCLQGPATRNINGLDVYKDCWQYQDSYTCVNPNNTTSTCDAFSTNPKCIAVDQKCTFTLSGGQCGSWEKTYQCEVTGAQNQTQDVCKNMTCDANGICVPAADQPDNDFGKVAAAMEMAREVGVYTDPNNIRIFGGEKSECSKGNLGIKSCCTPKAGATSNAGLASSMFGAALTTGKELMDVGSMYMYDALSSSQTLQQGMGTMISSVNNWFSSSPDYDFFNAKFDPSFSMMGFTASYGAAGGSSGGVFEWGATKVLGPDNFISSGSMSLGSAGGFNLTFNPYMLLGQLFINWVLTCDPSDAITALRKGQNLCHHVGTYCSSKFLGACVQQKEAHCCYNSHLQRIVQEQGRIQLGKGWGTPEAPQCEGFTVDEFSRLDMSSMDLSEFIAEIQAKAVNTIPGTNRAVTNVTTKVNNYFGTSQSTSGASSAAAPSLYLPGNSSGNLHQTATGNALNKSTTKGAQ
jgi:conjugal transfer mating pair stabilization protein TraN